MDEIKTKENNANFKKTLSKNSGEIDTTTFDETLMLIEKTLKNLGKEIDTKEALILEETEKDKTVIENKVHKIDSSHLKMEDLHNFNKITETKNKNFFGFYIYLTLTIAIIFVIYEALNFSKNLIIVKYPFTATYIEYFYEVVEIFTYLVMGIINFIKNLFSFGAP